MSGILRLLHGIKVQICHKSMFFQWFFFFLELMISSCNLLLSIPVKAVVDTDYMKFIVIQQKLPFIIGHSIYVFIHCLILTQCLIFDCGEQK